MIMILKLFLICWASAAKGIPQDWNPAACHVGHYLELGCIPVMGSGCCPDRFDCSHMEERSVKKCYISGKSYEIGEVVSNEDNKHICAKCTCSSNEKSNAVIECSGVKCSEHTEQLPHGVILQYSLNDCCAVNQVRGEEDIEKLATCELDGEMYKEGQKMIPKSNNCAHCICGKGFTGKIEEPFCKISSCGVEVHDGDSIRNNCAPIYYGTELCCPINWKCPEDSDVIIRGPNRCTDKNPDLVCKYGDSIINKGDVIIHKNLKCTACACHIPPIVTCITDPVCNKQN